MPKFSVCIPAYKSRFLSECIQSILGQSYVDFEVIVLNDCSPEPVAEIVRSFSDARIRYYETEHNLGAIRLTVNCNTLKAFAYALSVIIMGYDAITYCYYLDSFTYR